MAEPTKAIVLQTSDQQHIGFTLFHPDFESSNGDCVFVVVPKSSDVLESENVGVLLEIKEVGEHQWHRQGDEIVVSFQGKQILKYLSDGVLQHIKTGTNLGVWFPATSEN